MKVPLNWRASSFFHTELHRRDWRMFLRPPKRALIVRSQKCLIGTSNNPRDRTSRNCPRDDYDEATTYDSYMTPEPGFRAGPGDSYDAA